MIASLAIWNASLIEMLWTSIGLVGLLFTRRQLRRSSQMIEATRKFNGRNLEQHRELRLIAYGHYRNAMFRLAKTCTILAIGALSMILPNTQTRITPTAVAVTVGLFMIELLIVLPGILDERQAQLMRDDKEHAAAAGRAFRRRSTD